MSRSRLKVWGKIEGDKIVKAAAPAITTQCLRVPVSNGHFAAVFVSFENKPSKEEILNIWKEYKGAPQELEASLRSQAVPSLL